MNRNLWINSSLGLVGQVLAFGSLFLPIFLGNFEQLSVQVFVSAIVSVLVIAITSGFTSQYPVLQNEQELRTLYKFTVSAICLLTLVGISVSWLTSLTGGQSSPLMISGTFLLFAQCLDILATTLLVRLNKPGIVALKRLVYGLSSILVTALVSFFWNTRESLVWAGAFSFAVGAAYVFVVLRYNPFPVEVFLLKNQFAHFKENFFTHVKIFSSGILDNLFVQFPSIAIFSLGPLAPAWAVVTRIGGGVSTIGLQLITPHIEARYSDGIRQRNQLGLKASLKIGTKFAIALSSITGVGIFLSLLAFQSELNLSASQIYFLLITGVIFWGSILWQVPKSRLLVFAGGVNQKIIWSISRAGLALLLILFFSNENILVGLGVIAFTWAISYELILRVRTSKQSKGNV